MAEVTRLETAAMTILGVLLYLWLGVPFVSGLLGTELRLYYTLGGLMFLASALYLVYRGGRRLVSGRPAGA